MEDLAKGSVYCTHKAHGSKRSQGLTGCPANTTCCLSKYSNSFVGCCMLPFAMDCGDSWHCCPTGSICDPECTAQKCSCRKAPWESKAARLSFSVLMSYLNTLWDKLRVQYHDTGKIPTTISYP